MTLAVATELRAGKESRFRSFKKEVEMKRNLTMEWKEKIKEKVARGADMKAVVAQNKERKRLGVLEELRSWGGPFCSAEEVEEFINREDLEDKEKQKRLKKELRFARESSTTLPSSDPLFRVQVTMPGGKRRDKNAEEFGAALMAFLGKKADSTTVMDYSIFRSSIKKYLMDNNNSIKE